MIIEKTDNVDKGIVLKGKVKIESDCGNEDLLIGETSLFSLIWANDLVDKQVEIFIRIKEDK